MLDVDEGVERENLLFFRFVFVDVDRGRVDEGAQINAAVIAVVEVVAHVLVVFRTLKRQDDVFHRGSPGCGVGGLEGRHYGTRGFLALRVDVEEDDHVLVLEVGQPVGAKDPGPVGASDR